MVSRISDVANGLRPEESQDIVASISSEKAINYIQQVIAPSALAGYTLIDYVNFVPAGRQIPVTGVLVGGRNNTMKVNGDDVDFSDECSYALKSTLEYGGGGKVPDGLRHKFMASPYSLKKGHKVTRPVTPLDWLVWAQTEGLDVDVDNFLHKPQGVTKTPSGEDMPLLNIYLSDVSTGSLANPVEHAKHEAVRKGLARKVFNLFGYNATELYIAGIVSHVRFDGNLSGAADVVVPVWAIYARAIHQNKAGGSRKTFAALQAVIGGVPREEVAEALGLNVKGLTKDILAQAFAKYDPSKAVEVVDTKYTAPALINPIVNSTIPEIVESNKSVAPNPEPSNSSSSVSMEDLLAISKGGNVTAPVANVTPNNSVTPKTPVVTNNVVNSDPFANIGHNLTEEVGFSDIPTAKVGLGLFAK